MSSVSTTAFQEIRRSGIARINPGLATRWYPHELFVKERYVTFDVAVEELYRDSMSKIDVYSCTAFHAANEKVVEYLDTSDVWLVATDEITKCTEAD